MRTIICWKKSLWWLELLIVMIDEWFKYQMLLKRLRWLKFWLRNNKSDVFLWPQLFFFFFFWSCITVYPNDILDWFLIFDIFWLCIRANLKKKKMMSTCFEIRVRIRLKILYSNFLFIHHEAEVGVWFYIVKNCYTSWNLCSKMSKMWSILLRNTVEFAPWLR